MKITLRIEEDDESAGGSRGEVEKAVRHWAATYAASLSHLCLTPQASLLITLDLQTDDLLTAIRRLHGDLYDLRVNFTVSVD